MDEVGDEEVKTVVLGAGRMGRRHIHIVKQMGLELVGICDPSTEALSLAEAEEGVSKDMHYLDADSMLEELQPECVVISTTATSHCTLTCQASRLGANYVLCEKPMATSLSECDQMIQTCQEHGTKLAVNHQMRFMEQYVEPKRLLNTPEYGGLTSITLIAGNFGLAMNGTHYFEMFRFMTDEAPSEIAAWFSREHVPNPRGDQFEDRAGSVRMTSSGGKRFYMDVSADQGLGLKVIYTARNGQIVVDELSGSMSSLFREEQYRELPTTRYGMPAVREEVNIEPADVFAPTRDVLDSLLNGGTYPTGEEARLAIASLVAAYISNENENRSVSLSEAETHSTRTFPWA